MITDEQLKKWRALADAAKGTVAGLYVGRNYPAGAKNDIVYFVLREGTAPNALAVFLNAIPEIVPVLIDEVERLREENERNANR